MSITTRDVVIPGAAGFLAIPEQAQIIGGEVWS
jgi:hypothetical protein